RHRVIVAERAVLGEVRITVAAPEIEVGLPVTDLAHAAAGIARARQTARRQAGLDREAHPIEAPRSNQVAHETQIRGAVRVVAVEAVSRLPAAGPIGGLGGMPVDLVVTGGAVRDPAVALADAAWPAIAVAGDAVDRRSVAGRKRVGERQVVVAAPADA